MTREAYVRYTWEIIGLEVVVGLEWREGEAPETLWEILKTEVAGALSVTELAEVRGIAAAVEHHVTARWPDRAYFLEVGEEEARWVQVYDPRGFIKERCPCVGACPRG